MVNYKRFAMVLGILLLLPLFIGLFFDAIYEAPEYDDFCGQGRSPAMTKPIPSECQKQDTQLTCVSVRTNADNSQVFQCTERSDVDNCADAYSSPEAMQCSQDGGDPVFTTMNDSCCQAFSSCNYCRKEFEDAQMVYNRNLFFILAPVGLAIVILGIFVSVEYIGAGFMFGGLITLFYATFRYFSDMNKLMRAIVILIELLIIIWIGYQKISRKDDVPEERRQKDIKQGAQSGKRKRNS